MLKNIWSKIPAHVILLFKLYGLNLVLFFFTRFFFYYYNKSSDVGSVIVFEKLMAFRMGLEFDTAVFCWITYFVVLIWSIAHFFDQKKLYAFGFYSFLILQLLYHFICVADIPYFKQFGTHLNKNAFLWSENPAFAAGVIFGSFSYWGFFILYFLIGSILIIASKKMFFGFKQREQDQPKVKWYYSLLIFTLLF